MYERGGEVLFPLEEEESCYLSHNQGAGQVLPLIPRRRPLSLLDSVAFAGPPRPDSSEASGGNHTHSTGARQVVLAPGRRQCTQEASAVLLPLSPPVSAPTPSDSPWILLRITSFSAGNSGQSDPIATIFKTNVLHSTAQPPGSSGSACSVT